MAHTDQEHFDAARKWQAHLQDELRDVGGTIPGPTLGQTVNDYRREMYRQIKRSYLPQIHDLYQVQWRGLEADALDAMGPQLLNAAKAEAYNPATVAPGEFRQITKRDAYGAIKQVQFIGPECFVKQLGRPGRLATIRTPDTHPGWFQKEVPSVWITGRVKAA